MTNSHPLNIETIRLKVEERIGNYALGFYKKNPNSDSESFIVKYVGRSDSILKTEIIQQGIKLKVKKDGTPKFTYFKFCYMTNIIAAYQKECSDYHEFCDKSTNIKHPERPKGMNKVILPCPKLTCKD